MLSALAFLLFSAFANSEECVLHFAELSKSPRLEVLRKLLNTPGYMGLVNETGGSFVRITEPKDLVIELFSSGLFDLYAIHEQSSVLFCDDGEKIWIQAFGRRESLKVKDSQLIVGSGGPKKTFKAGSIPEHLAELHKVNDRMPASLPEP